MSKMNNGTNHRKHVTFSLNNLPLSSTSETLPAITTTAPSSRRNNNWFVTVARKILLILALLFGGISVGVFVFLRVAERPSEVPSKAIDPSDDQRRLSKNSVAVQATLNLAPPTSSYLTNALVLSDATPINRRLSPDRKGADRRPSTPFLTGDGFRSLCDLVYDEGTAAEIDTLVAQQFMDGAREVYVADTFPLHNGGDRQEMILSLSTPNKDQENLRRRAGGQPVFLGELFRDYWLRKEEMRLHWQGTNPDTGGIDDDLQEAYLRSPLHGWVPVIFVQTHLIERFIDSVLRPLASGVAVYDGPVEDGGSDGEKFVPLLRTSTTMRSYQNNNKDLLRGSTFDDYVVNFTLVTHNSDYSAPWEASNTRMKSGVVSSYKKQRVALLERPLVGRYTPPYFYRSNEGQSGSSLYARTGTKVISRLPPRIQCVRWFAQNAAASHPNLFPIPIGIENRYNKFGRHTDVYAKIGDKAHAIRPSSDLSPIPRERKLFVSFSLKTNPKERGAALKAAQSLSPSTTTLYNTNNKKIPKGQERLILEGFLETMASHQFVLAPHGHGLDTHRMWEALYMGCIPITVATTPDPYGTPISLLETNNIQVPTGTHGSYNKGVSTHDVRLLSLFPVIVLKDFSDLTDQFFASLDYEAIVASKGGWRSLLETGPLNIKWWERRIRGLR